MPQENLHIDHTELINIIRIIIRNRYANIISNTHPDNLRSSTMTYGVIYSRFIRQNDINNDNTEVDIIIRDIHHNTQGDRYTPQTVSVSTAPIQTENSDTDTNSSTDINPDDENSQGTCSICLESLNSRGGYDDQDITETTIATLNRCRHQYHNTCLNLMKTTGSSLNCPQCRAPFTFTTP